MQNGKFTKETKEYLLSLEAVEAVKSCSIIYSKRFKEECMRPNRAGEKPGVIFASAGLPSSLIGYKRIERAIYHWKEADKKGSLLTYDACPQSYQNRIDTMKREKREAVARQRAIRERQVAKLEEKLERQRKKAKSREEKIIEAQASEINRLKSQVKALKALGTLARRTQRAQKMTKKSERFELIFQLAESDFKLNISAACEALEVSRRGYYDWLQAAPLRASREEADLAAKELIVQAAKHRGFKKGTRQIVDCLRRTQSVRMNRKKVQRIMRKYGIVQKPRRKRPYHKIGTDGLRKVAPNTVDRNFRTGKARSVLSTDITYLRSLTGFSYLSAVIDCETAEVLAYCVSNSATQDLVLKTYDQLKGYTFSEGIQAQSDQGCQYTGHAYREKLDALGIIQSMSKRACCWDNAPIESFWGRLKEEIGITNNLSHTEIIRLIDDYIYHYNNERGQARLGWRTPKEYAEMFVV